MRPIVELLERGRGFALFSHRDPDGDAVGSALGLAWVLRAMGKRAEVFLPEGVPELYRFLPGAGGVRDAAGALPEGLDAVLVLDATAPSRLGELESRIPRGVPVGNVDHHPDNTRFGEASWVDPEASATALMIHEMVLASGWEVPPEAAECLYVGILTDTGRFTFSNTDARTLRAAGELAARGADPHAIARRVYECHSLASLRLLGRALSTLEIHEGGAIACMHVTRAMLAETGARLEDSDGFSIYPRSVRGVRVGVFLREAGEDSIKVSFRSNEGVAIDGLAGRFGGGGHASASGARLPGPLEEAKEAVLRAVSEHLRSAGG
jgi:phosphoesterase RecJ-like protein